MRALLAILAVVLAGPLKAQPLPEGDEVRVREGKGAPWSEGVYAGSDSASMVLTQDGVERVYELLEIERIEWKAQKNLGLQLPLSMATGAAGALLVEYLLLITSCEAKGFGLDCREENFGLAAGIGAAAGASLVLISYAISPRDWKNVTKHYPPAGEEH